MTAPLPTAVQAKEQAKNLRATLTGEGTAIGHAQSLERVSHQYGFRDWNALLAVIGNGPPVDWTPDDKISGSYLSQPFAGQVVLCETLKPGWVRLEIQLDAAIDVVTSSEFSNLRRRIRGVIGPKGHSSERTSDGQPHLRIDM
ncbi:glyoxalase superfamily protein [Loktanella agnita]|uniref:glyoxalase superfamily protein n=1 Tax=Loktanella agnita TaxID=287097 RepID=UPI00398913D6